MYFNAYPVTPGMGLRESINAMLQHVAYNGRDFGYLPSAAHESNYLALLDAWEDLLVPDGDYLKLAPVVSDSSLLASLADDLVGLCNDYPVYDDEIYQEIEHRRVIAEIDDVRTDATMPCSECIASQLYDSGAYIEQSEYGACFAEDDFTLAVESAECDH